MYKGRWLTKSQKLANMKERAMRSLERAEKAMHNINQRAELLPHLKRYAKDKRQQEGHISRLKAAIKAYEELQQEMDKLTPS